MNYLVSVLAAVLGATALQNPSDRASLVLLNPALPSVYLQLDQEHRSSSSGRSDGGQAPVLLSLHNNTRGAISVCTESMYVGAKVKPLTLQSGKNVLAMRDGTEVAACYQVVEESADGGMYRVIPEIGDVHSTSWIASGDSVKVSIPAKDIAIARRICIGFNYEWETNSEQEMHVVLFGGNDAGKQHQPETVK